MFFKKKPASESTVLLQDLTDHAPPLPLSGTRHESQSTMADIDPPAPTDKASRPKPPPVDTHPPTINQEERPQRRFFSVSDMILSRARTCLVAGKEEGPRFRPLPDMAARIPASTAAFKLSATFRNYSTGFYNVHWRVKALDDFYIPNGLHFVVNVSYDTEPDISGSLDVIFTPEKLKNMAKNQWYNLMLEEKLVIHPHVGVANVQVILCNNENVERDEYTGFVIEHVEIRPIALRAEAQAGVRSLIVQKAAVPNFVVDTNRTTPLASDWSYVPPISAPISRLAAAKGGRFLATLALSRDAAHIKVFDLTFIKNPNSPPRNLAKFYGSCAMVTIQHPGINSLAIGISISHRGDQVAVFQEPKIGQWQDGNPVEEATFPFRLFDNPLVAHPSHIVNMNAPTTSNVDEPSNNSDTRETRPGAFRSSSHGSNPSTPSEAIQLQEVQWSHELLVGFIGFGEFPPVGMKSDWEKSDVNATLSTSGYDPEETDGAASSETPGSSRNRDPGGRSSMFVACNGLHLDVFEISAERKWKRSHTITFTDLLPTLSRRITCKMMMESLSANTFMWLEDSGRSCTIWDLATGANITHISSIENARFKGSTFRGHSKMAISPHESIVALASVDGCLTTYFANTGMAIDDRKFPGYKIEHVGFHAQDDHLYVILRDSVTFKLDARILDTLQLKSEQYTFQVPIPIIGSTILAFFYSKGYWNRGMICEADGARVNCYVSHQQLSSKVNRTNPSVWQAQPEDVVYECLGDETLQFRLLTGVHRELLPEGDGVSYWVHRVELHVEDTELQTRRLLFSFVPEPWMRATTADVVHPENLVTACFIPGGTRFMVSGVQTLQIWTLPTLDNSKCSLQFIWSEQRGAKDLLNHGPAYKSTNVQDYYQDTQSATVYTDLDSGLTMADIKMLDKQKKRDVPIPGPGTVGARHAIVHCFRSIHLLAAAYAFSSREARKTVRDNHQQNFTYEDHAEAILRFTREHINRMMSIGVYAPNIKKRPRPNPIASLRKTDLVDINSPLFKEDTAADSDDDRPYHHDKNGIRVNNSVPAAKQPGVVTILTLLLDHPFLQENNHAFVEGLLTTDNGDWIPRDNKSLNPIKRAIDSRNGRLVDAFIDYCIRNAKKYHPSYLMPAVQCLNELSDRYPAVLADMFRKASYIPAHNRAYVASHAIIANPQHGAWLKSKVLFWRAWTRQGGFVKSNNINDYAKPVFHLRSQLPFRSSAFLNILSVETSVRDKREEAFPARRDAVEDEKKTELSPYSHKIYVSPFPKLSTFGPYRAWYVTRDKQRSAFTDIAGQDFFDSPAMVATLEFKWHKYGFFYWIIRFLVVLLFSGLFIAITARQIDVSVPNPTPEQIQLRYMQDWRPVIKVNIGLGFALLLYEFAQFWDDWQKYIWSPYNYLDLMAYVMPVLGCFMFLHYEVGATEEGPHQIWVMSFGLLALYINVLFELRIIRQLGIIVNIILNITRKIWWFFMIFALFLIAFTHALLHLLHTRAPQAECTDSDGNCPDSDGYPRDFPMALSATYFFLAGRYDPVETVFEHGDTSFHIMMVIFFFFTAILLLNVLIALMNDAFTESKDQGQLAWLKQWSEVIAEIEIFSMPGRSLQNRNYFPDYIYYGANEQEAELYESKYYIANKSNLSIENRFLIDAVNVEQNAAQLTQRAVLRDVQTIASELERLKTAQDGFNQDVKGLAELMAAYIRKATGNDVAAVPREDKDDNLDDGSSSPHPPPPPPPPPPSASASGAGAPSVPRPPRPAVPRMTMPTARGPQPPPPMTAVPTSVRPGIVKHQTSPAVPQAHQRIQAVEQHADSPTSISPTVHFNSPATATPTSGNVFHQLPGSGSLYYPEASTSTHYKLVDLPETDRVLKAKSSHSSLKRRLQQKLAVVHTLDETVKSQAHNRHVENNASHPLYVVPGSSRLEDEVGEGLSERYVTGDSPSQTDPPRRTQSEMLLTDIPHEHVPLHVHPPRLSREVERRPEQTVEEEQTGDVEV